MAFANLTQLTLAQYQALSGSFTTPPTSSSTGSPDSRVTIALGGWASQTLMKFTIQNAAGSTSSLAVNDPNNQTINITVNTNSNAPADTTYWSIECGATDSRDTDWTINYDVNGGSVNRNGKWVFVKGKAGGGKPQK